MRRIADRAESAAGPQWHERLTASHWPKSDPADRITAAVSHAGWQAAIDADASAILCCTRRGRTARAMARLRPAARLIALSPDPRTVSALTLTWGVEPMLVREYRSSDEMVSSAVAAARAGGHLSHGDVVLVLAGAPHAAGGPSTDVLRVLRVE
jgi:pyruvate kinase